MNDQPQELPNGDSTPSESVDRLAITARIRALLDGRMQIDRYQWNEQGAALFHGRFLQPTESFYRELREMLASLGFTPFLERDGSYGPGDTLLAVPIVAARPPLRLHLPIALFLITIVTSMLAGAMNHQNSCFIESLPSDQQIPAYLGLILQTLFSPALFSGWPFALTVLSILLAHEMGHFLVGRWRGAPVSPPYFIPLPPPLSFTGTMGAVIVQREPMEDRKTILEIGLAGPFAGLIVAIPILIFGLATSNVGPPPTPPPGCSPGYTQEGNSLLYAGLKYAVFGQILPGNGVDVQLNDIAWGAWIGLLVTMLNLLPVGQLDGGHAAYALLGRRAHYLSYGVVAACVALGVTVSDTWLVWAVLVFLIGPRHPAPLNDVPTIQGWHRVLAIAGLAMFILLFMPAPLSIVTP
jgi:hypothetical protein